MLKIKLYFEFCILNESFKIQFKEKTENAIVKDERYNMLTKFYLFY